MSLYCVGHIQAWGKVNLGIAGANSDDEQCGVCVCISLGE